MKFTILNFDTLESTNTEAMNQARRGADEGLCVVAARQTAGRGRHEPGEVRRGGPPDPLGQRAEPPGRAVGHRYSPTSPARVASSSATPV